MNIYSIAKSFLVENVRLRTGCRKPDVIVNAYLDPVVGDLNLAQLNRRLLSSAQNTGRLSKIIGGKKGLELIRPHLFGFDPKRITSRFDNRSDDLFAHLKDKLQLNDINEDSTGSWPKYCRTILSSAKFLNEFGDADEFFKWARSIYRNKHSLDALPMLLESKVYGIGYALACDFLKELTFTKYGKPDIHMCDIFHGIGLSDRDVYRVQKEIFDQAKAAKVSAYNVDKVFWLIGSGNLYKHKKLGKNGNIGRMKNKFVKYFNDQFDIES
jgi:hypothetical protein